MILNKCKLCESETTYLSSAKILDKYDIAYFKCPNCGFIQTEDPYWLEEAYTEAINSTDVGLVNRNIIFSKITKTVISTFFDKNAKFLDYGGGYGLFVRIMRDFGFDFYRFDKYCANLFAQGFEADIDGRTIYELATAFEVFEHLTNPVQEIGEIVAVSKSILFSTELLPPTNPKPGEWWYYGLEHGQHISFYTLKSLSFLAAKFNLNLYSDGKSIHMLTNQKLSPFVFRVITKYKVAALMSAIIQKKSLLEKDYNALLYKIASGGRT